MCVYIYCRQRLLLLRRRRRPALRPTAARPRRRRQCMVRDRARLSACPARPAGRGRSDRPARRRARRPPRARSVHVAGAARDGGAAAAVRVGGLLRRAVAVVGPPTLVARHLVGAQRGVADVPVGGLPRRQRPPDRVAGGEAAAAEPELLRLVHVALAHGAGALAAPPHRQVHRAQVPDLRRPWHREERDRRHRQQERQQGAGAEAGHVVERGGPCCC